MRIFIFLIILSLFVSCIGPSSRYYKTLDWEDDLLAQSDLSIFPSDILNNPDKYDGNIVHWVGIIDTFDIYEDETGTFANIMLDQKYYDYIEDYSIQTETIFLSPIGEGKFYYKMKVTNPSRDSLITILETHTSLKNLAFCYGQYSGLRNGIPGIEGLGMRVIHEKYYATTIFSYIVERDSLGSVVINDNGYPALTEFKILKVPEAGEND